MNTAELLAGLQGLPGARESGAATNGITAARLLNGIEYAATSASEESKLRSAFRKRQGGGATPLVLVADDPAETGFVLVLGPQRDGPLRRVRADALLGLVERTTSVKRLQAVRMLAEELDRLDVERIAGLRVRGLGTEHLYGERLPASPHWEELSALVAGVSRAGWRELLTDLGYRIESLRPEGYLARHDSRPAIVIHPRANAWLFARLDDEGRLPEGALLAACREHGAPYGILAAGTRIRLLAARDAGAATRYLELDAAALEPDRRPLLGLLSPRYLLDGGFDAVLEDARSYGQTLRRRLDRTLRQDVLPVLGKELGAWAAQEGRDLGDDGEREELEAAALLFVFRALFLLYAESAGHLPMANPTYRDKSLTRTCERAWEEREAADKSATALWDDVMALVRRMRTGHTAWELPAYNGELFAAEAVAGAAILERAAIPDAALAPALIALARDEDDPQVGIDFSGLEIGHLGYIYEGLLSLRLSVADRDLAYDANADRYRPPADGQAPDVRAGELLWLTNEGGRKGAGVYYTRTELVRHLVRGAVGPAFDRHLEEVRALAAKDPAAAAGKLFDFAVLDPACGSAHFLVEVVDELADKVAALLGELSLPAVREQLDALRARAASFGAGIEDTALLKRLVLKRCVYGVDLSAMGVEIAKVSLWLSTFVPGLSLAFLDHNVQRGNSLIGVADPGEVTQRTLFGNALTNQLDAAAKGAAALRTIDDATPEQVQASREAHDALREQVSGAATLFDLWTAEHLGLTGARHEAEDEGDAILAGNPTPRSAQANELSRVEHFLHWPLAFAEVFARERPGFDAVVGNPPWEEVTVEELAFYARYRPGLRALPQGARAQALDELLATRPELVERYESERDHVAALRAFFAADAGFVSGAGDPDVYKLFCGRYRALVRRDGAIGVVLPRSAWAAKGSADFRGWMLSEAPPERIDFLLNRRSWAFDIHPQYSVSLTIARRGEARAAIEVAGVADSAEAFERQVAGPGLMLGRTALGRMLEVPLLPDQPAADLLAKLRATGSFAQGGGRWRCFAVRELDETNDKKLWTGESDGWPLWKGSSFDQYDPHGADARPCPPNDAALAKARKSKPGAGSLLADSTTVEARRAAVARALDQARVAFRDVTRATDSRTARACLVPSHHFLTNTAPYLAFLDDDARAQATCLGVLNSLPFDWQARRFVEIHLNFFVLDGLKVPNLGDEDYAAIARAAARLSCTDERFAQFAERTGVEVGPLTDAERDALRAEIDARVARAWGMTADELEVVFADFTLDAVPAAYRDLVRSTFAAL